MGYFLNLVYDKWNETTGLPYPNGIKHRLDHLDDHSSYVVAYKQIEGFSVDYRNKKIEDVSKYPNENFIYLVWYRYNFTNRWFSEGKLPVSEEIIQKVKENKNLYIVFMNECEVESRHSIKFLNEITKSLNINQKQIWLISNNSRLSEFKKVYNTDINVHTSRSMQTFLKYNNPINFKSKKNEGSFFMCHNRTPKIHRYGILILLKHYNILNDTDWSLINGWFNPKHGNDIERLFGDFSPIFSKTEFDELFNEIKYFTNIDIYKSKYEKNRIEFENRNNQHIFFEAETYENAYFNITTESNYLGEDVHISEKSFKPFFYLQFPLILASYQHIKFMKEYYDFDFFDDVINHDYDNEKDDHNRIFKFIEEIKRIHDNKDFFIDFYEKNKDRFIRNYEKLLPFHSEHDYKFFEYLNTYGQ